VMVGVIDVATNEVESAEQVAARIAASLEHIERERMLPCTNCGLAPLPFEVAQRKLGALGAGVARARTELG
jgi:5-methyltetrahydropteroyltriglutamate--homocysteine methyltransferase